MTRNLNPVPEIPNLRDIGGLPAIAGRSIRTGLVFRAAAPSSAPENKEAVATALIERQIKNTYDLRSGVEVTQYDSGEENASAILPASVQRVAVPVFRENYSPEAIAIRFKDYADENTTRGFASAYRSILADGNGAFTPILKHLATEEPAPLLVHCTAGKDRTGVICALILSLCGVEDEAVAEEYGLTTEGLSEWRKRATAHLLKHPALANNPAGVERLLSSKPENMLAALKMLREEYGSAEGYVVKHCGLSLDEVEQIRKNLTVSSS